MLYSSSWALAVDCIHRQSMITGSHGATDNVKCPTTSVRSMVMSFRTMIAWCLFCTAYKLGDHVKPLNWGHRCYNDDRRL